jgi:hypothetical protein
VPAKAGTAVLFFTWLGYAGKLVLIAALEAHHYPCAFIDWVATFRRSISVSVIILEGLRPTVVHSAPYSVCYGCVAGE